MNIVFGLFLFAHGLVHAMYAAHALRLLEVRPGLLWPDSSWALSGLLGDSSVRVLVAVAFALIASGFAVTGAALIFRRPWWASAGSVAAIVSTVVIVLAWNGSLNDLADQGLFAIMINVVVVVSALVLKWPRLAP